MTNGWAWGFSAFRLGVGIAPRGRSKTALPSGCGLVAAAAGAAAGTVGTAAGPDGAAAGAALFVLGLAGGCAFGAGGPSFTRSSSINAYTLLQPPRCPWQS